jgi:hypothetical protein
MRRLLAALGLAILVPACASTNYWRQGETTDVVALVVRTEPPGAQVRINRLDRTWTTPCEIADPDLRRGHLDVTVTLSGYDAVTRRLAWDGESPARLDVKMTARSLGIVLQGAPPGARVLLIRTPPQAKDPAALVRLWSENEDVLKAALEGLSDANASLVPMRLGDLAQSRSEAVATLAKAKAKDGVDSVQVVHRVTVDGGGGARMNNVPPPPGLYLLVTRAGWEDFLVSDLKTDIAGSVTLTYPPPVKPVEAAPTLAKLTVKAAGDRVRVTAAGKVVADVPTMPEESVKLTVPREKVLVEFLDSKTGAVTGSVELAPDGDGSQPPAQPADLDRVGRIQLVSPKFGIFVRLEPGQELSIGDVVVVLRQGVEVARAKVLRVCAGDRSYPAGAAMLSPEAASARKGDEARRPKP